MSLTYATWKTTISNLTVIEEAHRLLKNVPPESPAAHAVSLFAELLAEIRAYGEGVAVAEQIPSKIISDVVKNSAVTLYASGAGQRHRSVMTTWSRTVVMTIAMATPMP